MRIKNKVIDKANIINILYESLIKTKQNFRIQNFEKYSRPRIA